MNLTPRAQVTQALRYVRGPVGSPPVSLDRVFELVYEELRGLASALMKRERSDHTLRPTALVHEAYLRLVDETQLSWENRVHFFGIAVRAMRQILVAHARKRGAAKRGGGLQRVTLDDRLEATGSFFEILALNDALDRLAELDERTGRVAELRLFTDLPMKDIGAVIGVSKRTADGEWTMARKWLSRELA